MPLGGILLDAFGTNRSQFYICTNVKCCITSFHISTYMYYENWLFTVKVMHNNDSSNYSNVNIECCMCAGIHIIKWFAETKYFLCSIMLSGLRRQAILFKLVNVI